LLEKYEERGREFPVPLFSFTDLALSGSARERVALIRE
jgi:hypothetical protein